MSRWHWGLAALVLLAACGGGDGGDGGLVDGAVDAPADSAPRDALVDAVVDAPVDGAVDGSSDGAASDASLDGAADASTDASLDGGSVTGFGTIAGPCGVVLAELSEPSASFFVTHLDFMMDGFDDPAERGLLTAGAQEILLEGTAGGSSAVSEAFAFDVLARCEGATLLKTETEIVYDPADSKKTDILVSIDGQQVGVSVTRAVSFPPETPYTEANAAFIESKLSDILVSTMNVIAADGWDKQILLIMAYGDMHAASVRTVWDGLDASVRADTIVYVVITDGDDDAIYF